MSADRELPGPYANVIAWFRALPALPVVLFWLLLVAGALAPLLFSPWHYNAFELPKALATRALAGLALLCLAYIFLARTVSGWWRHPLVAPVLALAAILIAASVFSLDRRLSVWGSYERQLGLLTWLAPLVLFVAGLVVLQTPARQRRLYQLLAWTSAPIVLYGMLQAFGADPFAWQDDGASAVLGTMGRSNFLGAYLVLIIPLTGAALLMASRRWPFVLLLAGQLIVLLLTRARAAWLGLLGAAVTFGLLWLVARGRGRLARRLALLGLLFFIVLLLLLLLSGWPSILTEGGSTAARLSIWRTTIPLLADRPLLGYGPDTMQLAFQGVFPPELVYYQGRHLLVDRAHNLWLDIGMSAGLLGLTAFIFVLWRAGRVMWRGLRETGLWERQIMLVGVMAAAAGHLVELQLSFETVGTVVLFWLVLALGVAAAGQPLSLSDPPPTSSRSWTSLPLALAFIILLAILTVRPLRADGAYRRGQQGTAHATDSLRHFVEAKRQWPIEPLYQVALAQAYWANGQPAAATSEAVSAAQQRPADARLWAAAGDLLARWAASEPIHYSQALAAYRRAIDLSPNTAAYHTALGLILAERGQLVEGIAAIERAVQLDATDAVAYDHLAALYQAAGQPEQAEWAASQARRWSEAAAGRDP